MSMSTKEAFSMLVENISAMRGVQSVGKSGDKELPTSGVSDIDLFAFCDQIPELNERQAAVDALGDAVTESHIGFDRHKYWGMVDLVHINGVETFIMYHLTEDILSFVKSVLNGERLKREDGYFYPTGRCATLQGMNIYTDKNGFLALVQEMLSVYPDGLADKLASHHLQAIEGYEDLRKAVERKDPFYFHYAMDEALDHYFQALFAANKTFYPSRKRNIEYIRHFAVKPEHCEDKLFRVLELGSKPDTLRQSYELFADLVDELLAIKPQHTEN